MRRRHAVRRASCRTAAQGARARTTARETPSPSACRGRRRTQPTAAQTARESGQRGSRSTRRRLRDIDTSPQAASASGAKPPAASPRTTTTRRQPPRETSAPRPAAALRSTNVHYRPPAARGLADMSQRGTPRLDTHAASSPHPHTTRGDDNVGARSTRAAVLRSGAHFPLSARMAPRPRRHCASAQNPQKTCGVPTTTSCGALPSSPTRW